MFEEVNSALDIETRELKNNYLSIIEEEGGASSFLVHHFISYAIKNNYGLVLVTLDQSFAHYQAVSLKLGNNLLTSKENNQVICIEAFKGILSGYLGQDNLSFLQNDNLKIKNSLSGLENQIKKSLDNLNFEKKIVIVDKLSILHLLGVDYQEIFRFSRSLLKLQSTIITTLHQYEEEDCMIQLGGYLSFISDCDIRVWPLKTGKSSCVSGNLSFRWNQTNDNLRRFQYLTEDKNVSVFALGASKGVL